MASSAAVWGIDIGQCALKAMRCRAHDDEDKIIVDAFDYIEYPKVLSQPDANPIELVADAIKQFLSRNTVKGECVAVSVPGQNGLARFIKLPPVEAKKIPDIVRYEAKQQIPFDLNDVIWDFQRMGGGSEESGFVLETEIGLFAMKRDAVFRALDPFQRASIEVDIVQLAPLSIYNFILFDQLASELPSPEEIDPDNPPKYTAVISLGTDATDLVITNGFRVWQRSVPVGGNHFTKALTKEMKLTFAKAEHLKRNATTAQDPKAVFQAMRPIFNDLQTELQRSLGFFGNMDRNADITRVVALGNAFKLAGLRRYLSQSLGFEFENFVAFRGLVGPEVLATPAFKDNLLSFGVCYGLCLQGLNRAGLRTNLLPKQILHDRIIRRKKPWAVAAAAVLLLGLSINYASYSIQLNSVEAPEWKKPESEASTVVSKSQSLITQETEEKEKFKQTEEMGRHLVNNMENRWRWMELLKGISDCLDQKTSKGPDPTNTLALSDNVMMRDQLQVTDIDSQPVDDVAVWWNAVKSQYSPPDGGELPAGQAPVAGQAPTTDSGPTGKGIIVQIAGHHYHNAAGGREEGAGYISKHLLKNLANPELRKTLGISYPVLLGRPNMYPDTIVIPGPKRNEEKQSGPAPAFGMMSTPGGGDAGPPEEKLVLKRFDFRVQFVWQYKSPEERAAAEKAAAEANPTGTPPSAVPIRK